MMLCLRCTRGIPGGSNVPYVLYSHTPSSSLPTTAPHCNTVQHTTTHCNTLQHTAMCRTSCTGIQQGVPKAYNSKVSQRHTTMWRTAIHPPACCLTLQHTATHCNTATHSNTARAEARGTVAPHCNTPRQHPETDCNRLQQTTTQLEPERGVQQHALR